MSAVDLATILAALPRLTGDEVARVYDALPETVVPWEKHYTGTRRMSLCGRFYRARVERVGRTWAAETWTGSSFETTSHPTARAAQAACDARLEAAGVKLCGEVVTEAPTDG